MRTATTANEWSAIAERLEKSFTDLNNAPTSANLVQASRNVVDLIDKLNIGVLKLAKGDITGNIKKVELVEGLLEQTIPDNKKLASGALWLSRTFSFVSTLMCLVIDPSYAHEEPSKLAKLAYEKTLKNYHNAVTSGIFNMGFKSLPNRKEFEEKIGLTVSEVSGHIYRFSEEVTCFARLIDQYY